MYNLRYHIASLTAVFIALAIGLVLGGIVVERGTLDAQRQSLVNGLRADFAKLSKQNQSLASQLELQARFGNTVEERMIKGRLDGTSAIIVTDQVRGQAAQASKKALEGAGAKVAVLTSVKPGLGMDTDAVRAQIGSSDSSAAPSMDSLVTSLAAEWAGAGTSRPLTDALVKAGAIEVSGLEAAPYGVLVLAPASGNPDAVLVKLGTAFKSAQGIPVGTETIAQPTGMAVAAADAGLGAVNVIDSAPGAWSLVEMASGGQLQFYGVGNQVDAAFPPVPEPLSSTR